MANNNPFMQNAMNAPVPGSMPKPGNTSAADVFELDLTNTTDNKYVIEDGNYRVKCIDIEQSVSQSGNPMFVWTFEVSEGARAGFQLKVFTAITPAAMWKVAETVQALGVGQAGTVVKFKRTDVIGKECGALVEQEEYNGQMRSSISRVMTLQELAEAGK